MLEAAPTGTLADCGSDDPAGNDPATADTWGDDRAIRAELLRWLCLDEQAADQVDPRGVVAGAGVIVFGALVFWCGFNHDLLSPVCEAKLERQASGEPHNP